jgi:hypothetical protein
MNSEDLSIFDNFRGFDAFNLFNRIEHLIFSFKPGGVIKGMMVVREISALKTRLRGAIDPAAGRHGDARLTFPRPNKTYAPEMQSSTTRYRTRY